MGKHRPSAKRYLVYLRNVGVFAVVAIVVVAVVAWFKFRSPPDSLAAAFEERREDFSGRQYCVLLPLSSEARLGHRVVGIQQSANSRCRLEVEPNACFFVPPPIVNKSLEELVIHYNVAKDFSSELGGQLHGSVADMGNMTLTLRALTSSHALGVINPNGPCAAEGSYPIVTSVIAAASAELSSDRSIEGQVATSGVVAGSSQARTSWSQSDARTIRASDIVLGGIVQQVKVTKLHERGSQDLQQGVSLSMNPQVGRRENLPDGVEGFVIVGAYSFTERWLDLSVNVPLQIGVKAWPGIKVCSVGKTERLGIDDGCYYLVGDGNLVLSLSWSLDRDENVILSMYAYRTEVLSP